MKKIILAVVITTLLVGGGAFFGGIQFGKTQAPSALNNALRFGGNMNPSQGGSAFQRGQGGTARSGASGGEFLNGEILSVDEVSMTIQLSDGGSKIVFFSDTSEITKSVEGTREDLIQETNVTVTGTGNDDGSMTATNIQIRPEGFSFGERMKDAAAVKATTTE